MRKYFEESGKMDTLWAVAYLTGRRPRRPIKTANLRKWAAEEAGIPDWLFNESYYTVGDLSETISLIMPEGEGILEGALGDWVEEEILPLRGMDEEEQKERIISHLLEMKKMQRFVFIKLITSSFRVGVSQALVTKALAKFTDLEEAVIAHRLMGEWAPSESFYDKLISKEDTSDDISRPYPFYLAYQLEGNLADLGETSEWLVEWKYDGIRCQIIKRDGQVFIWSRGEEMLNNTFPEIEIAAQHLPDGTVLDSELMAWQDNMPMPFSALQKRIGRKKPTKKILAEVPIAAICFDMVEYGSTDLRELPLADRRQQMTQVIKQTGNSHLVESIAVKAENWDTYADIRSQAREKRVEGFMIKRLDSTYRTGRRKGDWWKWKIDPLTVDAVMIYAQRGSGRRATMYSDYTFAVWDGEGKLIPFTKAYSGLTDKEMSRVDKWIKSNTIERFGPVRSVKKELVFEVAFEGINESSRHKSGIAVRFPRILRWREDKKPEDADTLESLQKMLEMVNR
jgi:DNA ligase-1